MKRAKLLVLALVIAVGGALSHADTAHAGDCELKAEAEFWSCVYVADILGVDDFSPCTEELDADLQACKG